MRISLMQLYSGVIFVRNRFGIGIDAEKSAEIPYDIGSRDFGVFLDPMFTSGLT